MHTHSNTRTFMHILNTTHSHAERYTQTQTHTLSTSHTRTHTNTHVEGTHAPYWQQCHRMHSQWADDYPRRAGDLSIITHAAPVLSPRCPEGRADVFRKHLAWDLSSVALFCYSDGCVCPGATTWECVYGGDCTSHYAQTARGMGAWQCVWQRGWRSVCVCVCVIYIYFFIIYLYNLFHQSWIKKVLIFYSFY